MKRLVTLLLVTLVSTGAAFAAQKHQAQADATYLFGVGGGAAGPTTTNNDDSCDIMVAPAATLLLPYFEVETASRATDSDRPSSSGLVPQMIGRLKALAIRR